MGVGGADYTLRDYFVSVRMTDIGGTTESYAYVPETGEIREVVLVNDVALAGSNAVLTVQKLPGSTGSASTISGSFTIVQSSSSAGKATVLLPTSANRFVVEGDTVRIVSDGGPSNSVPATAYIRIRR